MDPSGRSTMTTIDRRSFLKTTAAVGLTPIPTTLGSVSKTLDDDPLGIRSDFRVTEKLTYIAPLRRPHARVHEAAIRYAEEQVFTPAVGLSRWRERASEEEVRRDVRGRSPRNRASFRPATGENITAPRPETGRRVVIDELHFITTSCSTVSRGTSIEARSSATRTAAP
jgi:hypothetical protein